MPRKLTPVIVIDLTTNKIVAEFASQAICRDLLKVHHRPVIRADRGKKYFGKDYVIQYKEERPTHIVYTQKAWYCDKHEVWIAKGMPCPICESTKSK